MTILLSRVVSLATPWLRLWLAVTVILLAATFTASVTALDPRLAHCGGDVSGNKVQTHFELQHARDFWTRFPAALDAPELRRDVPLFVAVFDGPYRSLTFGPGGGERQTLDDVVCVVFPPSDLYPDGERVIYHNISRSGFVP